jgi:hypothetical protein
MEPATLLSTDKFALCTLDKKYTFRVEEASQWVDQINGELHKRMKEKKWGFVHTALSLVF